MSQSASNPLLTIVIPAFRCAKFLPATVASALRCDDARILIAEDHSNDNTFQVAQNLAAQHPDRITAYRNEKNLGMTGNWQNAMSRVQTPFALKLDADDLISVAYVRVALKILQDDPRIAMIGAHLIEVSEDFALTGPLPDDPPIRAEDFIFHRGIDAGAFGLNWHPYPASSTTMFRMDAWRSVGGYDLALNCCSDREIWFRIARHHDVATSAAPALHYRVLASGITSNTIRNDRFVYEFSHMFRQSKKIWPEPQLAPLYRRAFRINAKAFFGSAFRALKAGRFREILPRIGKGITEMFWALR